MDEMNLADLVREISRSVQQTVSNNSKTFVEIRRTVDSTVKERPRIPCWKRLIPLKIRRRAPKHPRNRRPINLNGWMAS